MRRTVCEVICDHCGVIQRFELTNNHGRQLSATTDLTAMLEQQQWESRAVEGASRFMNEDVCRACNGRIFK